MRSGPCVLAEEEAIFPLQDLGSKQGIDGKRGKIGELNPFFSSKPFISQEGTVRQGYVEKVPCMRMLGIQPTKVALELASLYLEADWKSCSDGKCLLYAYSVLVNRQIGVQVEIGIDRCKHEKLRLSQVKAFVPVQSVGGEAGYPAAFLFVTFKARLIGKGIEDKRNVRVSHKRATEEAAYPTQGLRFFRRSCFFCNLLYWYRLSFLLLPELVDNLLLLLYGFRLFTDYLLKGVYPIFQGRATNARAIQHDTEDTEKLNAFLHGFLLNKESVKVAKMPGLQDLQ